MAGTPLISVRGLRKSYDSPAGTTEVLHGIDFDIMPGEFVAVMGPSGSGKSTICGLHSLPAVLPAEACQSQLNGSGHVLDVMFDGRNHRQL